MARYPLRVAAPSASSASLGVHAVLYRTVHRPLRMLPGCPSNETAVALSLAASFPVICRGQSRPAAPSEGHQVGGRIELTSMQHRWHVSCASGTTSRIGSLAETVRVLASLCSWVNGTAGRLPEGVTHRLRLVWCKSGEPSEVKTAHKSRFADLQPTVAAPVVSKVRRSLFGRLESFGLTRFCVRLERC